MASPTVDLLTSEIILVLDQNVTVGVVLNGKTMTICYFFSRNGWFSYVIEDLFRAMIAGLVKSNKGGRSDEFEHHELQPIGGDSGELLTWKEIYKTSKPLLSTVFHGFKLLRVWDLENLQIGKLPGSEVNSFNFRRFILTNVRLADEKDLCAAIDNMKLHKLFLKAANEEGPLRIDALSSPSCLEKLKLVGKLEKVACWFPSLHPVTFLLFLWSRLREDPLPCLQAVPNLARIIVVNAYVGKQLCFLNGFQKLKILNTYNCNHLNEIVLEKEMMPGLQSLSLGRCMKLKALPHGIDIHNC
ncbi:hypothetical protein POTOM_050844 [Populus tomentosa]|uniref:Uncharacterized protein n=1 Tax=Populus tomentosa TaxID=118781 RepID=A0A8X7YJD6_POPTO|nr:hypothetical protein POTOM_050844 [Populus tomentosa]